MCSSDSSTCAHATHSVAENIAALHLVGKTDKENSPLRCCIHNLLLLLLHSHADPHKNPQLTLRQNFILTM